MVVLSIIVISHNQREPLKRCVDSILAQKIPFDYEVLISDDASTDGSYELAQGYADRYPVIHAYSCDTNTMKPSNKSFRSGMNRCNALQHAQGKYVAHIDGDDFLLADSHIYQKQVELLEKHPECSCCMANDYTLVDGEKLSTIQIRHPQVFETGYKLKKEDYIRGYFRESHCFVYRRNLQVDPIEVLGGYYVDNALTAFYVQFGDIVCLNDVGYVYVQYQNSIWHEYEKTCDHKILGCPALFVAGLLPAWKPVYWSSRGYLRRMKTVVSSALRGEKVTVPTLKWMDSFDYYLFHAFNRPLTIEDKMHLIALYALLEMMWCIRRLHLPRPSLWRLLDKLL